MKVWKSASSKAMVPEQYRARRRAAAHCDALLLSMPVDVPSQMQNIRKSSRKLTSRTNMLLPFKCTNLEQELRIETVSLYSMGRCEDSRSHLNNLNTAPLKASPMGAPRSSRPRSPGNATKLVKLKCASTCLIWVKEKHCQPISQ